MSRRDFELIARVVCESGLAASDVRSLAEAFARALAATHPRFDRARFLAACGVAPLTR